MHCTLPRSLSSPPSLHRLALITCALFLLTTPGCGPDSNQRTEKQYNGPDITQNALLSVAEDNISATPVDVSTIEILIPIARLVPEPVDATLELTIQRTDGTVVSQGRRYVRISDWRMEAAHTMSLNVDITDSATRGQLAEYILSWRIEDQDDGLLQGRRSLFDILPTQDVRIMGPDVYHADVPGHLRISVVDPITGDPIQNARVRLSTEHGKVMNEGETDLAGRYLATLLFEGEDVGQHNLVIDAVSGGAEDRIPIQVEVVSETRTMITTDKPIYRPGQTVHIRTLTLRLPDRKPIAGKPVTLEIQDSKGNRIAREQVETDEFGIAATHLQLADQVNLGEWNVNVTIAGEETEKTIPVDNYALPKFKAELQADHPWYRPGETAQLLISADYFFGQPVAGGEVLIQPRTIDAMQAEQMPIALTLDDAGLGTAEIPIPPGWSATTLQQGTARLLLDVSVTDATGRTETESGMLVVASQGLILDARLTADVVPGKPAEVLVLVTDPLGNPAAANGFLTVNGEAHQWSSDESGLAEVSLTPDQPSFGAVVSASTPLGDTSQRSFQLGNHPSASSRSISLTTDQSLYDFGDVASITISSDAPIDSAELDILREGRLLDSHTIVLENGAGTAAIPLQQDGVAGLVTFEATAGLVDGSTIRSSSMAWVDDPRALNVEFSTPQETFRPGEDAQLDVRITDESGNPVAAALGITIVDEAVYALQEVQPGIERLVFQLAGGIEHLNPASGASPATLVGDDTDEVRARAARVLFAGIDTAGHPISVSTWQTAAATMRQSSQRSVQRDSLRIIQWFEDARESGLYTGSLWDREDDTRAFLSLMPRLYDPWGTAYQMTPILWSSTTVPELEFLSAGPDERFDTQDDASLRIATSQLR